MLSLSSERQLFWGGYHYVWKIRTCMQLLEMSLIDEEEIASELYMLCMNMECIVVQSLVMGLISNPQWTHNMHIWHFRCTLFENSDLKNIMGEKKTRLLIFLVSYKTNERSWWWAPYRTANGLLRALPIALVVFIRIRKQEPLENMQTLDRNVPVVRFEPRTYLLSGYSANH